MISKILNAIKRKYYMSSSDRFCNYLRNRGICVGGGCHIDPKSSLIDLSRPSLISIGSGCYMNFGFTLLTHDWVTKVFIQSGREFLPSSGRVKIGNNVSFGQNVMVLKGVSIGDNCFIGAGSIVTRDIPANSIAVGAPCKVVMSLEDYYLKRKEKCVLEALDYAKSIRERFNRDPKLTDFWEEFPLFISGDKIDQYPEFSETIKRQCGPSYNDYVKYHKSIYNGFEEFIKAAELMA